MQKFNFEVFADYFQFYLIDENATGTDFSELWVKQLPQAEQQMVAVTDGVIGVITRRNTDVPVVVEVNEAEPLENYQEWDQVTDCSINILSGQLIIGGATEDLTSAARIKVKPGTYRVRIFYGSLDSVSANGLDGEDHYKIVLWSAPLSRVVIVKQWNSQKYS
ncbi:MAG TPA: hypothetical protein DCL61_19840 [Cyanobacteria bacterium UBA12227]|nr:hypothetical protein [Cyanobacteria bacterium UBA12227]HBY81278.1 hypothetical protein [Cyanobacteria bacterium UBA11148]